MTPMDHKPFTRPSRNVVCAGRYDVVYVRRLCHHLDARTTMAVQQFAETACAPVEREVMSPRGRQEAADEEVIVLMSNAQAGWLAKITCAPKVERFLTCRLVASMLCVAGQATQEGHTFMAATDDERLLLAVQALPTWLVSQPSRRGHAISRDMKSA